MGSYTAVLLSMGGLIATVYFAGWLHGKKLPSMTITGLCLILFLTLLLAYSQLELKIKRTLVKKECLPVGTKWQVLAETPLEDNIFATIIQNIETMEIVGLKTEKSPQKFVVAKSGLWRWKKITLKPISNEDSLHGQNEETSGITPKEKKEKP